eukprot:maker-scaffold152_size304267-snap-gene-0.13 protein:Tk10105 transcript:maker-scaffold152_size304267-snap-gene-0.13-mRNA-1 annotation:"PREDICTED: uncharacterized protein LOC100891522"
MWNKFPALQEARRVILPKQYKEEAGRIYNLALRPDDIWVVTYPKCGTTWSQSMVVYYSWNRQFASLVADFNRRMGLVKRLLHWIPRSQMKPPFSKFCEVALEAGSILKFLNVEDFGRTRTLILSWNLRMSSTFVWARYLGKSSSGLEQIKWLLLSFEGFMSQVDPEQFKGVVQMLEWFQFHFPDQKEPSQVQAIMEHIELICSYLSSKWVSMIFREEDVTFVGDISKMFSRMGLVPDDAKKHRFLWKMNGRMAVLQIKTLTFGEGPSASVAMAALHKVAEDYGNGQTEVMETIYNGFCVDDLADSTRTLPGANKKVQAICEILAHGNFEMSKWLCNRKAFSLMEPNSHVTTSVLGLFWDSEKDVLRVKVPK